MFTVENKIRKISCKYTALFCYTPFLTFYSCLGNRYVFIYLPISCINNVFPIKYWVVQSLL